MRTAAAAVARLHLVRHGESEANADAGVTRRVADADIGLTRLGERQAAAAGRHLAAMLKSGAMDPKRTAIDVSPYARTVATWSWMIEEMNHVIGATTIAGMPVSFDARLREIERGAFHGLERREDDEERAARFPVEDAARIEANRRGAYFHFRNPGGESRADGAARAALWIADMRMRAERNGIRDFIVVGHGTAARLMAMTWLGEDERWFGSDPMPENASIRTLGERGDHGYVHRYAARRPPGIGATGDPHRITGSDATRSLRRA